MSNRTIIQFISTNSVAHAQSESGERRVNFVCEKISICLGEDFLRTKSIAVVDFSELRFSAELALDLRGIRCDR